MPGREVACIRYQEIRGSKQTGAVVLADTDPNRLPDLMLRSHQVHISPGRG